MKVYALVFLTVLVLVEGYNNQYQQNAYYRTPGQDQKTEQSGQKFYAPISDGQTEAQNGKQPAQGQETEQPGQTSYTPTNDGQTTTDNGAKPNQGQETEQPDQKSYTPTNDGQTTTENSENSNQGVQVSIGHESYNSQGSLNRGSNQRGWTSQPTRHTIPSDDTGYYAPTNTWNAPGVQVSIQRHSTSDSNGYQKPAQWSQHTQSASNGVRTESWNGGTADGGVQVSVQKQRFNSQRPYGTYGSQNRRTQWPSQTTSTNNAQRPQQGQGTYSTGGQTPQWNTGNTNQGQGTYNTGGQTPQYNTGNTNQGQGTYSTGGQTPQYNTGNTDQFYVQRQHSSSFDKQTPNGTDDQGLQLVGRTSSITRSNIPGYKYPYTETIRKSDDRGNSINIGGK